MSKIHETISLCLFRFTGTVSPFSDLSLIYESMCHSPHVLETETYVDLSPTYPKSRPTREGGR